MLLECLCDDFFEDFLLVFGQELEFFGLVLVECLDEDDSLNLYVVGVFYSQCFFDVFVVQGYNVCMLCQENVFEGVWVVFFVVVLVGLVLVLVYICFEYVEYLVFGLVIVCLLGEDSCDLLDLC